MKLEERIILSQKDEAERNLVISEYTSFVKSAASKATGNFITESDDEFSVALIAFNEAIERYEGDKGSFLGYASLVIKSRITDYLRKSNKEAVPISSITEEDEEIELCGPGDIISEAAMEINALSKVLSSFGITFMSLSHHVPVSRRTKEAIKSVLSYVLATEEVKNGIVKSGIVPGKEISEKLGIHKKVIERHRKYIVAATIILTGDYENVKPYVMGILGKTEVIK